MKLSSRFLARTAILGALVVIFDYALKFSGFKIPFPWLPFLKFDFTGIPIVLSLLLIGPESATVTSTVAFLAILVRSGDVISAFMKAVAEFSTVLGMYAGLVWFKPSTRLAKPVSFSLGCVTRVLAMTVMWLVVLPVYTGMPFDYALLTSPLAAAFNVMHGLVSMFGGFLVYEALVRRIPSMAPAKKEESQT